MWLLIVFGLLVGLLIGFSIPVLFPVVFAKYMSIAVLAALDSVFGGIPLTWKMVLTTPFLSVDL